jgi:small-conductance mechanosensitive channel
VHSWWTTLGEVVGAFAVAAAVSLIARRAIRRLARRAAVHAAGTEPSVGSSRSATATRAVRRADAVARLIGRLVTLCAFCVALLFGLDRLGINLVLVISSAGFLGLAVALSGQGLIRDLLAGTQAMVEDRYAIGDRVTAHVAGTEITGTVDAIAAASVRIRRDGGATCHVGHDAIDYLINHSQTPTTTVLTVPADRWREIEPAAATTRLAASSNDIGLTGVVFVADVVGPGDGVDDGDSGEVELEINANRPLTRAQSEIVKQRLLDGPTP